ncbi:serine hydrolase [Marinobacter sp. HL-58]|uniref:serine hydrolase n=1 Tax=Marinobacter sp. HL-58 TaxID=1479237 RepID=UPI0006DA572F|nr:serine hydrolase [Marinobacter sp. HL-58]KPQ02957.1 MAG: beta-lactamase AmpC [Marinobacter sp. HL-58]
MDQANGVDAFRSVTGITRYLLAFAALMTLATGPVSAGWEEDLEKKLAGIDDRYPGELGVYVHNLEDGKTADLRAGETWYLASTIKVPVAMAVMEAVDSGELTLDTDVELKAADFVDGAGETNWKSPGDRVSVRYLFEQMLTHSDNTATDVLIRLVGMDAVNQLVRRYTDGGIGEVTTLADVRRYAYSRFHEQAMTLSSDDMFTIKKAGTGNDRVQALAEVLDLDTGEFLVPDLDAAFDGYYESGLNSGRLDEFSLLFEALAEQDGLSDDSSAYLLSTLENIKTGDNRIKAGLPDHVTFIHKTGTQYRRACNIGLVQMDDHPGVIIAACGRGTQDLNASELAFRRVGEAVSETGVFEER